MTNWNTNMHEAPENRALLITSRGGGVWIGSKADIDEQDVAWMLLPKPYQEPCPERIKASDPMLPYQTWKDVIDLIEDRTLQIVEWHLRNRGMEGGAAHEIIEELKND